MQTQAPNAAAIHELNRQQAAIILEYVSAEDAFARGVESIMTTRPDADAETLAIIHDPRNREWVINHYLDAVNDPRGSAV
jgi:hypothetical protein